ncbi:hypothetical protein [Leptospira stimsonii]|uniref:hypothetical protein n=1 Tax=Leptospira stimsonii TaxID=2202203 RepID=UPI0019D56488|nr:hypothetical protein [Leptospira stimsonii]
MKLKQIYLSGIFLGILSLNAYTGPFTHGGDGTVLDQKSGLVWQKCASGQGSAEIPTQIVAWELRIWFLGQPHLRIVIP